MAAQLEKLAKELADKGYPFGAFFVRDLSKSLLSRNLIPQTVTEGESTGEDLQKNPNVPDLSAWKTREFLRSQGVSIRTTNALCRSGMTARRLAGLSDYELLGLRHLGKRSVEEIRQVFPEPEPSKSP